MTKRKDSERDDDSDTTTTVVEHRDPVAAALSSPPTVQRNDASAQDGAKKHTKPSKTSGERQRAAKDLQAISDRLNGLQHEEFDARIDNAIRRIGEVVQALQQEDPAPVMTEEEALAQMQPPKLPVPNIPTEQGNQQPQPGKPDTSVSL